jgi:hypothetical protein
MSDVDKEVAELKQRVADAEKKKILVEHKKQTAESELEKARVLLEENYGITSVEEAKALLLKIQEEINAEVAIVEDALSKFQEAT